MYTNYIFQFPSLNETIHLDSLLSEGVRCQLKMISVRGLNNVGLGPEVIIDIDPHTLCQKGRYD